MTRKIFNTVAAAQMLGVSKQTLLRYEKKGIFPKAKRNTINHWREYTEADLQKLKHVLGRI